MKEKDTPQHEKERERHTDIRGEREGGRRGYAHWSDTGRKGSVVLRL